ncbi:hypothetical protein CF327_g3092 [Tilletia walkeri]|uniref:Uncharacterized protein n=1 Tax=Tilletia walkeri TaxID=117179 RepID=A0A8X7N309_9BASI|nr:hypothetical protein CF327_g3092 [Tilletia walkeri]KAE8264462.1 hypothetical protein A4X09_0g6960 [Tilletia walkeri]
MHHLRPQPYNRASCRLSTSNTRNGGPPQIINNSRSLSNAPFPANPTFSTHIHLHRREATQSTCSQPRQSADLMSLNPSIFASPTASPATIHNSKTDLLQEHRRTHRIRPRPWARSQQAGKSDPSSNATQSTHPRTPSTPASTQVSPFACLRPPNSPFRDSLKPPRLGSAQQDVLLAPALRGETASTHGKAVQNKPHQTSATSE